MNIANNENVNENFDFEFLYCTDLKNKYQKTYSFLILTDSNPSWDFALLVSSEIGPLKFNG